MGTRSFAAAVAFAAIAAVALAADAPRKPHPHFKDGGVLSWSTKLADAQAQAKAQDKMIFIQYGREACGNCRALVERVLPDATVKDRVAKFAVGLAADCDASERPVQELMRANLPGAGALPFTGFVTHDLKWVAGNSGYLDAPGFLAMLEKAEKSPLLDATPEDAKKLDVLAKDAAAAAEKAQWPKVFASSRAAAELKGRSDARAKLAESVAKARAWAEEQLAAALTSAADAAGRPAARGSLQKLASVFRDEPEAKEAEAGVKALERLGVIEGVAAEKQAAAREKAAKDFAGTRWTALFAEAAAKPAEAPK